MSKERRENNRYVFTEKITIQFDDEFLDGTETSDISLGGMCIIVKSKINKHHKYGTVMIVQKFKKEVVMFETKFVKLWDNSVYLDKEDTRIGIKFINVDPKNYNSLCKIIDLQEELIIVK